MARTIGARRHRVVIETRTDTGQTGGGVSSSWATLATVWASVQPLKGMERLHAQQLESPVTHKVTIHYRSDVTTKHRLTWGSRTFNIRSVVDVDERRRATEMICEEGVGT